jgi:hypothetical protein
MWDKDLSYGSADWSIPNVEDKAVVAKPVMERLEAQMGKCEMTLREVRWAANA